MIGQAWREETQSDEPQSHVLYGSETRGRLADRSAELDGPRSEIRDKEVQFEEIHKKGARLRKKLRLEQQASQSQDIEHWSTRQD